MRRQAARYQSADRHASLALAQPGQSRALGQSPRSEARTARGQQVICRCPMPLIVISRADSVTAGRLPRRCRPGKARYSLLHGSMRVR